MWKVYIGGMKKKFQTKELRRAATNTGIISKIIAMKDTIISKMSATTLYPKISRKRNKIEAISKTNVQLSIN
jgi:hypothetical protein